MNQLSQITIRILPFSGKESEWRMWSRKFIATAMARGYKEVLEPRDPTVDASTADNDKAYNELMLSINDEVTFGIVDEAKSTIHPTGDARVAWNELKKKYEPKTGYSEVKLKRDFNSCALNEGEDPDAWINNLLHKRRQLETMGTKLSERDVMIHILGTLPKAYDNTVDMAEKDLMAGSLTIESLRELLRIKFEKIKGSDEDVALFTKQFKGSCRVCGKVGHKAVDCFTLPQNKAKKEEFMKRVKDKKKGRGKGNPKGVQCFKCKEYGHIRKDCPKGTNENESANKANEDDSDEEVALICRSTTNKALNKTKGSTWVADTGASGHMCNNIDELTDIKSVNKSIEVGNGSKIACTKMGTWKGIYKTKEGKEVQMKLRNVMYVPGLKSNLLSLTVVMNEGWELKGTRGIMGIEKDKKRFEFTKHACGSGCIYRLHLLSENETAFLAESMESSTKRIHEMFCHSNMKQAKEAAKKIGLSVKNVDDEIDCEDCKISKAKQKKVDKVDETRSQTPGERLCIDISSVKTSKANKKFWVLVEDQASCMKWSFFVRNKDEQVEPIIDLIKEIHTTTERVVSFIRCDNAGENKLLEKQCRKEGLGITFEYTARNTPQQNGQVERSFATLYSKIRAMLRAANMTKKEKEKLWTEAASTATKVDNLLIRKGEKRGPYRRFYKKDPEYQRHLRVFGEKGIMTKKSGRDIKSKLEDRGQICTFLGYARNHTGDTYRMRNDSTEQVVITRDIIWTKGKVSEDTNEDDSDIDEDNDVEPEHEIVFEQYNNDTEEHPENEGPLFEHPAYEEVPDEEIESNRGPQRLATELRMLKSYNNPGLREEVHFCFNVEESTGAEKEEPTTFQEAWNHPESEDRVKWRTAIRLEFRQMLKNGVWRYKSGRKSIPSNRKAIGTKWVFKIKKSGIYRARLVAKGYDQVAGIDFLYNFAPVINDTTFKVLLTLWLEKGYKAKVLDVKTAFLYGKLSESVYIKRPEGYDMFLKEEGQKDGKETYLELEKTIYGLVQAAREWWKTFIKVLTTKLGFQQFQNDNCLLKREDENGFCAIGIYVDDCIMIGDEMAIKNMVNDVKKHFDITTEEAKDFIGCTIERKDDEIHLHQPDLIKRLLRTFENDLKSMKDYDTPASSGYKVVRPQTEEEKLGDEDQKKYRSGVGSLLYLVKHTRPDLSNIVRELSKAMDGANESHMKALLRAIKFVEVTKNYKLIMKSCKKGQMKWRLRAYSDSDYAGDSESRRSISGYILYLNGCAVCWRSRGQKSVSLSSTEAEYRAQSDTVTEVMFVKMLVEFLGFEIEKPITVHVDNLGAIYLAKSAGTSNRTKHIDTHYHFVREHIEDGTIQIEFVRSDENHADLFTKNLPGEGYGKYQRMTMGHQSTRNRKGVEMQYFSSLKGEMKDRQDDQTRVDG